MKIQTKFLLLTALLATLITPVVAQTNSPATNSTASVVTRANPAIIPVRHETARTDIVLKTAKDNQGPCDIAFIGDSITQGWEGAGRNVWKKYYADRKALNFGVGGDRTEHVLWRFEHGQLDGIQPKVTVLMIGTNNSNKNKDGSEQYSEAEILEGVTAIVKQIQQRTPETKLLLVSIFPRAKTFSTQRGKLLQVNQALEKLADNKTIFWIDFGSQLIEADGSISTEMMHDALHPGEKGYAIWAEAIEPKLKELLAGK